MKRWDGIWSADLASFIYINHCFLLPRSAFSFLSFVISRKQKAAAKRVVRQRLWLGGWHRALNRCISQVHHPQSLPDHVTLEIFSNKRSYCSIACPNSCFAQPLTSCMLRSFLLSVFFIYCVYLPACLLLCRRELRTTRCRRTNDNQVWISKPTHLLLHRSFDNLSQFTGSTRLIPKLMHVPTSLFLC